MDVIIVCHTEFGYVKNKKVIGEKKAVFGTRDGVLNLIKIAERYSAKVSFAVCPEVVDYFPKNIIHEVGLHVHPGWEEFKENGIPFTVGDQYLREHCKQSSISTVLWDYSYDEQLDMIKTGKEYISAKLNVIPKFFVAGRWCVNNDTVRALIANDFTHDCSATAHSKPMHHDWSRLPRICMPYHPRTEDYQKKGDLPLLMVPISQSFPRGNVNPEVAPMVGLSWLKACFTEYYRQGVPLFHICLHSPSMTDSYFMSVMDNLLGFISGHQHINFKFASEIRKYPDQIYATNLLPYVSAVNWNIIKSKWKTLLKIQ